MFSNDLRQLGASRIQYYSLTSQSQHPVSCRTVRSFVRSFVHSSSARVVVRTTTERNRFHASAQPHWIEPGDLHSAVATLSARGRTHRNRNIYHRQVSRYMRALEQHFSKIEKLIFLYIIGLSIKPSTSQHLS